MIAFETHTHTGSQFVQSSVERIQSFLTRFHFPAHSTSTTESYLLELLNPRDEASTVESQKVQEFISHCLQHQDDLSLDPNGRAWCSNIPLAVGSWSSNTNSSLEGAT